MAPEAQAANFFAHALPKFGDYEDAMLVGERRHLGLGGWRMVRDVLMPAALPHIISGLRTGWAFGWRTIVAAELVFGVAGKGGMADVERLALQRLLHQVDAPAGAVHLLAPKHVRGAGRQAEPAVHAGAENRLGFVPLGRGTDELGEMGFHDRLTGRDTGGPD